MSIEFILFLLIPLGVYFYVLNNKKNEQKRIAEKIAIEDEVKRLEIVRSKMNDVEWENYLLQYQNQKLNEEILAAIKAPRIQRGIIFPSE